MTISNGLFQPVRRLEHYRRAAGYLRAHRAHLVATGASKRELKTLDDTVREIDSAIAANAIYPLDTPEPEPPPETTEQPLCHPGDEAWMEPFIAELAGDAP